MQGREVWLSIFDYSKVSGKSISTIRRYIKSGRVSVKKEDGKYLILSDKEAEDCAYSKEQQQIEFLKQQLIIAREEISELKMLVDLYENKGVPDLPPIPKQENITVDQLQ